MSLSLALIAATLLIPTAPVQRPASAPRTSTTAVQKKEGQVLVSYGAPCKDPAYANLQKALEADRVLDKIALELQAVFVFPEDWVISYGELGTANAFYDPKTRRVTVGYEMFDALSKIFAQEGGSVEANTEKILRTLTFVTYHEIGHALVDVLNLPITGREEDSVDQFSYWMLRNISDAKGTDNGSYAAVDAAKWFALSADSRGIAESQFWDSHSLNQQRFYDILALVHGTDPKKFEYLVKTHMLPAERAANSRAEWLRVRNSWDRLLAPHIRKGK